MPNKKALPTESPYISIKEFGVRIGYSYSSAYNMARSKYFRDMKISEKLNLPNQKGGVKINWPRFLETRKENPVVREYCKPKQRSKLA